MPTFRWTALAVTTALVVAGCGSGDDDGSSSAADTTVSEAIEPVTLTIATYDAADTPGGGAVASFVDEVTTLSDGAVTIEPTYAIEVSESPEEHVIDGVTGGEFDLGLTASRAFDLTGVTSFQALQTPFLVTNEAAAAAVASSDVATDMLSAMGDDAVGLALWPEDFRHPFSVVDGEAVTSPEDLDGQDVRVPPSAVSEALIDAMGGTTVYTSGAYGAAEAGWPSAEFLDGVPTGTGNVVFYPKFQVLYANADVFGELSEAQQDVLREAAAATRDVVVAERPSEAEGASDWCASNGSIVLADDDQVAAFEAAAQPVTDLIAEGETGAANIDAIEGIVADTDSEAVVPIEPCSADAAVPASDDRSDEAWESGLPPDGQWRATQTVDQFLAAGVSEEHAEGWAATVTLTFDGGEGRFDWVGESDPSFSCLTTYEVVDDFVRLTYESLPNAPSEECDGTVEDWRWRMEGDALVFDLLDSYDTPFVEDTVAYEVAPYVRVT